MQYRIKSKDELLDEYGPGWYQVPALDIVDGVIKHLGRDLTEEETIEFIKDGDINVVDRENVVTWKISSDLITSNNDLHDKVKRLLLDYGAVDIIKEVMSQVDKI